MYSVDDLINQLDQGTDGEDNGEENIGHFVEEAEEDRNDDGNQNSGNENDENEDENKSPTKVIKKPRKQSNRPKLDVERLKGPRGLMCMEKLFSKLQFQGHGHEKEDLDIMMNTMQYWCHRLFPKFSFDDTLEHLEKLGVKKPLITLKKKILFDLMEEDQPVRQVDDVLNNDDDEDINPINDFDILLEQETIPATLVTAPPVVQLTDDQKEMIERNRLLAAERRLARLEAQKQKEAETSSSQADSVSLSQELETCNQLTEAQKEIIERNRLLAIEKRRALLERQADKTHHTPLSTSEESETLTSVSGEYDTETNDTNSIHLSQLAIASQGTVMSQNSGTVTEMEVLLPQSNINAPMSQATEMGVAYQSMNESQESQISIMQDSIADSSSSLMASSEYSTTVTNSQNSDSMCASQSASAGSSQINQSSSQKSSDICEMEIATQSSEILSSSFSSSRNLVNVKPNPTQIKDAQENLEMDVDD